MSIAKVPVLALLLALNASAGILRISEATFAPLAGQITFSEFPVGTQNPTYDPSAYGAAVSSPIVTFGGYFSGQALGSPGSCPSGTAPSGCVIGSPSGPLTLNPSSPSTFITMDGPFPSSPTLSGSPQFNGPISVLFSTDVAGVALDAGYFDAIGSTTVRAFDRQGNLLGEARNAGLAIEFFGMATDTGRNQIAGLQFSMIGSEPGGFTIDNLRFGIYNPGTPPGGGTTVPEPGTWALLGVGMAGLLAMFVRRR